MTTKQNTLTLSRWGNSLSIRMPKKVLKEFNLTNKDKVSYQIKNGKIILTPVKKESPLRRMFDGFDTQEYFKTEPGDKEDDWGKPQGKEDF